MHQALHWQHKAAKLEGKKKERHRVTLARGELCLLLGQDTLGKYSRFKAFVLLPHEIKFKCASKRCCVASAHSCKQHLTQLQLRAGLGLAQPSLELSIKISSWILFPFPTCSQCGCCLGAHSIACAEQG